MGMGQEVQVVGEIQVVGEEGGRSRGGSAGERSGQCPGRQDVIVSYGRAEKYLRGSVAALQVGGGVRVNRSNGFVERGVELVLVTVSFLFHRCLFV